MIRAHLSMFPPPARVLQSERRTMTCPFTKKPVLCLELVAPARAVVGEGDLDAAPGLAYTTRLTFFICLISHKGLMGLIHSLSS